MPLAFPGRPDAWELPLFLHVLGAMVLVGALMFVATALLLAWNRGDDEGGADLRRWAFRTMFVGVLPSFVLMRVAAEWIASKEFPEGTEEPGWVGVGYLTTDAGGVLLLISLVLSSIGFRRSQRPLGRVVGVLSCVLLVAYLVAMWAMTAKPS